MASREPPRDPARAKRGGASREGLHWGRASVTGTPQAKGHVGWTWGRGTRKPPLGRRHRSRPDPCACAGCPSPCPALAATPAPHASPAPPAMGEEDYYLELCERPVHFEKANPVNCVFFDEANKQVGAGPHPPPSTASPPGPRSPARPAGCRDQPGVRQRLPVRGPGPASSGRARFPAGAAGSTERASPAPLGRESAASSPPVPRLRTPVSPEFWVGAVGSRAGLDQNLGPRGPGPAAQFGMVTLLVSPLVS